MRLFILYQFLIIIFILKAEPILVIQKTLRLGYNYKKLCQNFGFDGDKVFKNSKFYDYYVCGKKTGDIINIGDCMTFDNDTEKEIYIIVPFNDDFNDVDFNCVDEEDYIEYDKKIIMKLKANKIKEKDTE
jgi:hypothetical protein